MAKSPYAIAEHYFTHPDDHWEGLGWRQAAKLTKALKSAANSAGITRTEVMGAVLAAARERASDRPPPLYVVNIGGSGSHWLGLMLGEIDGLTDAAEVYIAPALREQIGDLDPSDQAVVVDAIHLLHGWGRSRDWSSTKGSSIVNSAHRPEMIGEYRAWDPRSKVVHLVRDPRDRVLSVTYRKSAFREQEAPGIDDEAYLRRKAKRTDQYLRRYFASPEQADMELKYESIKSDPTAVVAGVVGLMHMAVPDAEVQQAVFRHDAENIRAGVAESKGNLDEGGVSGHWSTAKTRDRLIMHHMLAFADDALGYAGDDCRAIDSGVEASTAGRAIDPTDGVVYHVADPAGRWRLLEDRVASGSGLRIRPSDDFDMSKLSFEVERAGADVLCLAGKAKVDNATISPLRGVRGLVGLDLSGTSVTSASATTLKQIPDLVWVVATDTPLEGWTAE